MRNLGLRAALVAAAVLLFAFSFARADTIKFDDLTDPNGYGTFIDNGYAGLNWNSFLVLNTNLFVQNVVHGPNGYSNGTVSGTNVAYGIDATISSTSAFAFDSAYFTAAWNNGLSISITGYLNNVQVDHTTFTVDATGPTLENFNWTDVDTLQFDSSGGTSAGYFYGASNPQFAMDNLTIGPVNPDQGTTTPLPSTSYAGFGLLGGVGCWMLARRRKIVAE